MFNPNSYRVHPSVAQNGIDNEGEWGELWEPFKKQTIRYVDRRSTSKVCSGLSQHKVAKAILKYYSSVTGRILQANEVTWGTVELTSALEKDNFVHGSVMKNRQLRHLKTRATNTVLFRATRTVGDRSVGVWLVATVQCYFIHKQNNMTRFLALGELMRAHEIDEYGLITVTKGPSGINSQTLVVFSTEEILECVGLVRY
ncbi:hypothetical protein MBANPS3_012279 [Mucor bainieri]